MATVVGRKANDCRRCQILNEKSNYSRSLHSLGDRRMIVREARVKGDLSLPALETNSRGSWGQLAPLLAPGEDLQSCDNGNSLELKSNLAGLNPCRAGIQRGRFPLWSLSPLAETWERIRVIKQEPNLLCKPASESLGPFWILYRAWWGQGDIMVYIRPYVSEGKHLLKLFTYNDFAFHSIFLSPDLPFHLIKWITL